MSTSTALALIAAIAFPGAFVFMYVQKLMADVAADIVIGVTREHPVSETYRWLMLRPELRALLNDGDGGGRDCCGRPYADCRIRG